MPRLKGGGGGGKVFSPIRELGTGDGVQLGPGTGDGVQLGLGRYFPKIYKMFNILYIYSDGKKVCSRTVFKLSYLCVSGLYQAIFSINAALGLEWWRQYIFAKISNILDFHQARSCSIRPFFREYEISGKMSSES